MNNTSDLPSVTAQQILQAFATLHARNISSNETLKVERSHAVAAKHIENARKAATNAKLRTKSETPTSVKETQRPDYSDSGQDAPLHIRPTSRTATGSWDVTLDRPVTSKADIQGRWQTSLLAGGTHGSISFSQKEQRVHNAAAIALESLKSCYHEADSTNHHTFEAHQFQDAVDLAVMRSKAETDAADETTLDMIDPDVIRDHLLGDGA